MTIDDLRAIARARLVYLDAVHSDAVRTGDAVSLAAIEVERASTESTLSQLDSL